MQHHRVLVLVWLTGKAWFLITKTNAQNIFLGVIWSMCNLWGLIVFCENLPEVYSFPDQKYWPCFLNQTTNTEFYLSFIAFINQLSVEDVTIGCFWQDFTCQMQRWGKLKSFFGDLIFLTDLWPTSSPYLTLPDIIMWALLQRKAKMNVPFTIVNLSGNIQEEIAAICVNMWQFVLISLEDHIQ